ncbi:MAG: M48 family metallopeptidase [Cellvibrionaceae bacterium]
MNWTTANIRKLILSILVSLALLSCATSPTGRSQLQLVSDKQMAEMGASAFAEIKKETPTATDPTTRRYVHCVASALTQTLDDSAGWEIEVFQDDSVNAFALPGKKIGVFSGLLKVAENQDQLAAVIGHEIAHVLAEHSNARVSANVATAAGLQVVEAMIAGQASGAGRQQAMALLGLGAQYGVLMPYGRSQEREADVLGLDIMAEAGFQPEASVALWQNMAHAAGPNPPELLSTHPSPESRMGDLRKQLPEANEIYQRARNQGRRPNCSA